ncbi:MAG TPA: RNA polymerase sigma-54 factor, partial [Candidatus Limnocylindria bacterium]|nr:RNA polymerase sigma-54 factor [Candidatus Limnocylindria bacterium]
DENPALEMQELPSCPICGNPVTGNYCTECMPRKDANERQEAFVVDDLPSDGVSRLRDEADDLDPIARAEAEFTLEEHLTWNLHAQLPSAFHRIADYVVGALDENGFLTESDAQIAVATAATRDDVEQVLSVMRGLEPIGIGSRSITESLLAQIAHLRELDDEVDVPQIAEAVVREHLQQLGERKFREIAQALGTDTDAVIACWEFVKSNLNPYPTSAFTAAVTGGGPRSIVRPDVIIRNADGELQVEVVESRRFSLHVAPIYSSLSSQLRTADATEDEKQHVREYVGRAKFFIDNINRRRATMQRIAECLCERQRDYLLEGVQHLVPLTRAEVGELIGMHESTVSRATADKFVMIPSGEVVPFSHFFTASLGVKDQIRKMIEAEDASNPYSDQEIAERLLADGVAIARRTVAKYRDELKILPARLRHR